MPGAPYYAEAFSPLPATASAWSPTPTRLARPTARTGRLAWLRVGAERPSLPDRRLPGPPAETRGGRQQPHRLASRGVVPAGAQVQVHPVALELKLVDLALAVVLTAGLEGEQLRVPRERLKCGQHVSYRHAIQRSEASTLDADQARDHPGGSERGRLEVMSQVWDGSVVTGPLGGVVMFVS
jgi:hypothetical protein